MQTRARCEEIAQSWGLQKTATRFALQGATSKRDHPDQPVTHVRQRNAEIALGESVAELVRDPHRSQAAVRGMDHREWLPSSRRRSYAMPFGVDAELYVTWRAVMGDLRNMLDS